MDAIETAIRNAFGKGDPLDPGYRQRVYRSAAAAIEKAIQGNRSLSPEAAAQRRDNLRSAISRIETEFAPAAPAVSGEPKVAPVDPVRPFPAAPAPEPRDVPAPPVEADARATRAGYAEPSIDAGSARPGQGSGAELGGVEDRRRLPRRRRSGGFLRRLLPAVLVLLLAAAGVWWALSSGLFDADGPSLEAEAPADATPPLAEPAEQRGGPLLPEADEPRDWITLFSPADPTRVTAPANASAEVMEDDSGRFVRIRSGTDGAPVSFGVGQGVMERIAGKRAVFNIVARAEEGAPTEIAVECDFGALGDCGRRRYAVNAHRGDFLFEVELPDGAAGAGSIAIVSDVGAAGKAVDIYEIRVATPR